MGLESRIEKGTLPVNYIPRVLLCLSSLCSTEGRTAPPETMLFEFEDPAEMSAWSPLDLPSTKGEKEPSPTLALAGEAESMSALAPQGLGKPPSARADPSDAARRVPHHQRVRRNVTCHDRARSDEGASADGQIAENRDVGAQGGTPTHQGGE